MTVTLRRGMARGMLRAPVEVDMARRKPREEMLFDVGIDPREIYDIEVETAHREGYTRYGRPIARGW